MNFPNMYILGAGFSKSAGLPLGTEIFTQILVESKKTILYDNVLSHDIEKFLYYYNRINKKNINVDEIELEEFISFLDIEHYLKLQGNDHWSSAGNKSQLAIRNIIAKLLHRKKEEIINWDLYEAFGRSLLPGDIIITFNYDTIIETVLDSLNYEYVFSPDDYSRRRDKNLNEAILILKLHGSIDWYSITPYMKNLNYTLQEVETFYELKHPIFSNSHYFFPKRVFSHLNDKKSNLKNIYRIEKYYEMQNNIPSVTEAPYVVSPSYSKIVYLNEIIDLWYGFNGCGNHCASLTIIGFSLPLHDEYLRQIIFNIIENYQDQEDLKGIYTKPPLRLVDRITSANEMKKLKKRYSFIDFRKVKLFKNGFCKEAILTKEFLKSIQI